MSTSTTKSQDTALNFVPFPPDMDELTGGAQGQYWWSFVDAGDGSGGSSVAVLTLSEAFCANRIFKLQQWVAQKSTATGDESVLFSISKTTGVLFIMSWAQTMLGGAGGDTWNTPGLDTSWDGVLYHPMQGTALSLSVQCDNVGVGATLVNRGLLSVWEVPHTR